MAELLDVVVSRIDEVAQDIRAFELRHPNGVALPAFTAGSHIDVHLPGGGVRQYSPLNDEIERDRYLIAVLRKQMGRGGSAAMHDRVTPGMALRIGTPRNTFALDRTAGHSLLIAGGIGITPLLAMARALHRNGRSFALHYASRSPARAAFKDEIAAGPLGSSAAFYHSEGEDSRRPHAASLVASAPAGTHVYLCGPSGLISGVSEAAKNRPDIVLNIEHFAAASSNTVASASDDESFSVQLNRSGRTIKVVPGQTILDVLRDEGIDIETSCESGVCGTCVTRVLDGEPKHEDNFLSKDDKAACDRICVCVSRAKAGSTLVLDL